MVPLGRPDDPSFIPRLFCARDGNGHHLDRRVFVGHDACCLGIFLVNLVAYASLCLLTFARLALYINKLFRDLASYGRGPGFLTSVAATCIFGCQVLIFRKRPGVGLVFWLLGLVLWFVIMYALFSVTVTKPHKPDTRHALHGGWLIPVVATQSVVVLGAFLAPTLPTQSTRLRCSPRHRSKAITQKDLDNAVEKVVAGPERKSRRLDEQGKRRVAYHEVGHALVAAYLDAKSILTQHRDKLETVAQELIKRETLDATTFRQLLGMPSAPVSVPAAK